MCHCAQTGIQTPFGTESPLTRPTCWLDGLSCQGRGRAGLLLALEGHMGESNDTRGPEDMDGPGDGPDASPPSPVRCLACPAYAVKGEACCFIWRRCYQDQTRQAHTRSACKKGKRAASAQPVSSTANPESKRPIPPPLLLTGFRCQEGGIGIAITAYFDCILPARPLPHVGAKNRSNTTSCGHWSRWIQSSYCRKITRMDLSGG